MKIAVLFALAFSTACLAASAATITALPTDTEGPLRHNVFHAASDAGGAQGGVMAWFDLDASQTSTWDPLTGALDLHVTLFSDSTLSNEVGSASATSDSLLGAGFNDNDGTILGAISWAFDIDAAAILGMSAITMQFIDHNYASNSSGQIANSFVGNMVTLWGADGTYNGGGAFDGSSLGVDIVMEMPEPGILLMLGLGLVALGSARRRR